VDRLEADLQKMVRQLKDLDKKVRTRIIVKANREAIRIPEDKARDIALSKFQGEGFMASQITSARRRTDTMFRIKHGLGVKGGAVAPKKGTYRASKTPLKRRGKENRWGLVGFSNAENAYYWRFLEFGRSGMEAKPFFRPAWESSRWQLYSEVKRILRKGIDAHARRLRKL
jgi:HK97 gp10 family phage protein